MQTIRLVVVALLFVVTLPAQVFIVDAAGGAGSHFTDLPQAVAAVPDGSTLRVRAGPYSPVTLPAKGLSIVGEGLVTMQTCTVQGTSRGQRVLLRNLEVGFGVAVVDAQGPVAIEGCICYGLFSWLMPGLRVVRSQQVRVLASQVTAVTSEDATLEIARSDIRGHLSPGLVARRSRCTLVETRLAGGDGSDASCRFGGTLSPADAGYPACDLDASTILSCNSTVDGGAGGSGLSCTYGAGGGTGVKAGRDCAFIAVGALPSGGAGGSGAGGAGPRGRDYVLGPNSRILHVPGLRTPAAWISGAQSRGQTVQLELRAAPASIAVFAFSYTGLTGPLEPFGIGSFLLQPALISAPLTVPTGGATWLPLFLPASLPLSEIYTGQALTWQPLGLLASNAFTLLLAQ